MAFDTASSAVAQQCKIAGNSDMYGLGIRIGFYLQWFSSVIASMPISSPNSTSATLELAPGESKTLGFTIVLFTLASFLALCIQAGGSLALSEVYIVLLLIFGYIYYFIAHCVTHAIACCINRKDVKGRQTQRQHSPFFVLLTSILMFAVSTFELWFWCVRVLSSKRRESSCQAFGFGFVKVDLTNRGFLVFNATYAAFTMLLSIFGLWGVLWTVFFSNSRSGTWWWRLHFTELSKETSEDLESFEYIVYVSPYAVLMSVIQILFAIIMVVAIELTIKWNHIQSVHSLREAGQTIPFILGLAALARVTYKACCAFCND